MGAGGSGQDLTAFGLRWDLTPEDGRIRLVLTGEIDLLAEGELERARVSVADAHLPVLLDLSAVDFMDSTGLRFLMRVSHDLRGAGKQGVTLGPISHQVKRLLEVAGLAGFFETSPASD